MKARKLNKRNQGFYFKIASSIYFYRAKKLWGHNTLYGWSIISNHYENVETLFQDNYAVRADLSELNVEPCYLT